MLGLLLAALLPLSARAETACPAAGETAQDCPWAGIARELRGKDAPLGRAFAKAAPGIARQLKADAKRKEWLSLWGESVNFDEGAKAQIVDAAVLEELARRAGVPYADRPDKRVHAGLEHTYG